MSHARTKSTARKGNPKQASRGAAVARARVVFIDAFDVWLNQAAEAMEWAKLAGLIGLPAGTLPEVIRQRLAVATLDEWETWTLRLINIPEPASPEQTGAAA